MGGAGGRTVHRHWHNSNRDRLADSLKRFLLITQRRIPLDRTEDYARLWHGVRHLVNHLGGRAWVFRAESAGHRMVEFVEWESDEAHRLIERPQVAAALDALATVFPATESETWIEAKI